MLNPSTDDHQWMQFYHQMDSQGYEALDAAAHTGEIDQLFNNSTIHTADKKVSSSVSPGSGGGSPGLSPKPVRRRSRASKKTPTKVLNANTNNFRALVQQYTGCPPSTGGSGSFKGPINWNFSNYRPPQDGGTTDGGINSSYLHNNTTSSSTLAPTSAYGHQQQLSSGLFPVDGFAAASGRLVLGQGSVGLGLDTAMNLDGDFSAMDSNTDSFPW
ncbi:hypothetical protein SAY87_002443 [Trapa incisa]|uniref:VQ domain-containing protein n=1 Tax=Trapa incisa TaxID=236973 RepID=A0AAN7PV32_9MYRT|nr:hypothetical protein SAY87_002443 [Trapa incisa]